MTDYLINREIHVYGIQRTGQHAIISWLIGHFDQVGFKNCMSSEVEKNKIGLEPPYWLFKRGEIEWDVCDSFPEVDNFILGTEFSKGKFQLNKDIEIQKKELAGDKDFSRIRHDLMVIRNPYNHYASVLNWRYNKRLKDPYVFKSYWKTYCKDFLEGGSLPKEKKLVVFDNWFQLESYRKMLSFKLGLDHTDERLHEVMNIGYKKIFGSGFDNMKFKSNAQKMDVLNRSSQVKESQQDKMDVLWEDEELKDLWENIKYRPF